MTASVKDYLDQLSSASAVPGGGSAAAVAGAMGVALLSMVARISAKKAKDDVAAARLLEILPALDQLRADLGRLSQDDIDAYRGVIEARKRRADAAELERAFTYAAEVPLETARAAERGLELYTEVSKQAWEMTRSDLDAGAALLEVGVRVALANVAVNLPELAGQNRLRLELAYEELAARRRQ
jgi:formiminotetrahydrofolate cyclodeaminase